MSEETSAEERERVASELPAISQYNINVIFQVLEVMEVKLEDNPLEFGPRHLNQKTAQARKFLADTEALFLRVASWIQKYKAAHRTAETLLDLNKKNLYTNDPETRAGRNFSDREAIASVKLRTDVEELSRITSILEDLEAVIAAIKSKRADLKDIQGRIRDQIKLCQEEIGLGGRWGSKPPPGVKAPELVDGTKPETLRDLQKLFENTGGGAKKKPSIDEMLSKMPDETELPLEEDLGEEPDPVPEARSITITVHGGSEEKVYEAVKQALTASARDEDVPAPMTVDQVRVASQDRKEEPVAGDNPKDRIVRILEDVETGDEFSQFPQIGYCGTCGKPQYETPSGPVCKEGHGGAETLDRPLPGSGSDQDVDSLLDEVEVSDPDKKEELDIDSILNDFGLSD